MTFAALPKAELHCHLIGVISPSLLTGLRQRGDKVLIEPSALDSAYPICDIASFKRWMELTRPYQMESLEAMYPILSAHVSSLIEQRVVYAEIMLSPSMFPRDRSAFWKAVHAWRNWTDSLEGKQVQIEFLMIVPRTLHPDLLTRDTETFIELYRRGLIAGVALVGPENGESLERFVPSFARWREAGLGVEIHAGEHCGPESVRDALKYGCPSRLGHALSAFQEPALLEEIRRANIHIEFCLSSNIRTAAVAHLEGHPAGRARQLGIGFSLNTDNPGAFQCSLNGEFDLAAKALGFGADDFADVFSNSLSARFQPKLRYLNSS